MTDLYFVLNNIEKTTIKGIACIFCDLAKVHCGTKLYLNVCNLNKDTV